MEFVQKSLFGWKGEFIINLDPGLSSPKPKVLFSVINTAQQLNNDQTRLKYKYNTQEWRIEMVL